MDSATRKPRRINGTPLHKFVRKVSFGILAVGLSFGFLFSNSKTADSFLKKLSPYKERLDSQLIENKKISTSIGKKKVEKNSDLQSV